MGFAYILSPASHNSIWHSPFSTTQDGAMQLLIKGQLALISTAWRIGCPFSTRDSCKQTTLNIKSNA